MVLSHKKVD
jgi:hypothetical protein